MAVTGIISFGAGVEVTKIHNRVYQNTEEQAQEKTILAEDDIMECYMDLEKFLDANPDIIYDNEESAKNTEQIIWEIEPNAVYVSEKFEVQENVPVWVSFSLNLDAGIYQVGMINESRGWVRYVDTKSALFQHKFVTDRTDDCALFVKNCSNEKIIFTGSYSYLYSDMETEK